MKIGRPSKYDNDFHPDSLVTLAKQGKTIQQVCAAWEIHKDTFYEWAKDKKGKSDFSDAIKRAAAHREDFYINFGMNIAAGKMKGANVTAYIWLTKNCLGWKDKVENTNIDTEWVWENVDDEPE